ncbi:MAG: hypothetical protein AMJ68_07985 [Acidithiobacillales bacterium SG8_45]|jgi:uncharacterized hydrophobic protein (TIGR00341 family)|nr:MAG: hypothetical protein AMJ68_07985 [Acidithiobacillales bacterium SG8_45]
MKIIEIIADTGHTDTISGIASQYEIGDIWYGPENPDGRVAVSMLVADEKLQTVLDAAQSALGGAENARILLLPVEASLPKPKVDEEEVKRAAITVTREELYDRIAKGAQLDSNYMLLVFLSTIVVAIGLIEDNVAVVVGAMVIAPLLGPNISLAFATALADTELMWESLKTNLAGMTLAFSLSMVLGYLFQLDLNSHEIMMRTQVNLETVALALASGAAAVLSLTTGLPSVLVGVMVAVALLPPTATLGLMLGAQNYYLAAGAGLLLAVNIVCINLSAKVAFLVRGVKPRTWIEKRKARQSMVLYIAIWLVSLAFLIAVIYWRAPLFPE